MDFSTCTDVQTTYISRMMLTGVDLMDLPSSLQQTFLMPVIRTYLSRRTKVSTSCSVIIVRINSISKCPLSTRYTLALACQA